MHVHASVQLCMHYKCVCTNEVNTTEQPAVKKITEKYEPSATQTNVNYVICIMHTGNMLDGDDCVKRKDEGLVSDGGL